jgi:outer membrane protein TolC
MEISYTADRRELVRAIRNAGLITEFTGKTAQAAVASMRNDREAEEAVGSGAVYWHSLEERTPTPE